MQLTRAHEIEQAFPGGGRSKAVELVFKEGSHFLRKTVKLSGVKDLVEHGGPERKAEAGYLLTKAVREAQRDAAYLTYGDAWSGHVSQFWGPATDEEKAMVSSALDMLLEQANG